MAKTKKVEKNSKPRVRISFLRALFILAGADLVLLLSPGFGLLNSMFYIGDLISWPSLIIGLALLFTGLRGVFSKQ